MNIVLFGKPGSGKGTIAKLLEKEYNLVHISTGDLLREEMLSASQLGFDIKDSMESGNFVSDSIVESLMIKYIKLVRLQKSSGYIFDGIPRNKSQCFSFDKIAKDLKLNDFHYIYLDCSDSISLERMRNRMKDLPRVDANSEVNITRKLEVYYEQTDKAVEYYDEMGELSSVNAELPVKEVFKYIKEIISLEEKIANGEEIGITT